jgi:hypothetical protein
VGALVIIWGGFPLGLLIASAFRRRLRDRDFGDAVGSAARRPNVTVIIATREPAAIVRKRVNDALASDYPAQSLDVVVTVDHQHPGLVDEIGAVPARARVVIGDAPGGKAAALNAGVRAATGDVLVFTGGIGENGVGIREAICRDMHFAGIMLDASKNHVRGQETKISAVESDTEIWIVPTNEELIVAKQAVAVLSAN